MNAYFTKKIRRLKNYLIENHDFWENVFRNNGIRKFGLSKKLYGDLRKDGTNY